MKFGVTSGPQRKRLSDHRAAGYTGIVRLLQGLLNADALERHVLATLRDGGLRAAAGREYFDVSVLGTILDVVDGWTSDRQ